MSSDRVLLSAADLDAYLPERATTNAFARPRLELKQRLLGWARRAAERLARDGTPLSRYASDEHPSLQNHWRVDAQWVLFFAESEARARFERLLAPERPLAEAFSEVTPDRRHAVLAVRVDAGGVAVSLVLHPEAALDVDNLRARLADEGPHADELTQAFARLPEQFTVGVEERPRRPCEGLTAAALRALLDDSAAQRAPLWVGWRVPRDVALAHAEELDEQLEDALAALAPLFRLVAWSKDNDHVDLEARIAGLEAQRAEQHAEAEAATSRWRAEREAEATRTRRHGPEAAPVTLGTLFALRRDEASSALAREPLAPAPSAPRAAESEPRGGGEPGFEKGARVLALKGPFAERVGVVAELVGRSSVRVLFGLLSARMELADLRHAHERRERPSLHSSHRRPLPTSPRRAR